MAVILNCILPKDSWILLRLSEQKIVITKPYCYRKLRKLVFLLAPCSSKLLKCDVLNLILVLTALPHTVMKKKCIIEGLKLSHYFNFGSFVF